MIYDAISDKDLDLYIKGLKELESLDVDFIVVVCNTIHLFYDKLQKSVNIPIIDLRKEVKKSLNKYNSALIIGTSNTIKKGLYRFHGIKLFEPSENEINRLNECIFNFNRGINKKLQARKVKDICQKYLKKGAQVVILGCTEFAVMLSQANFPKINTIDVLINSTIEKSQLLKIRGNYYEYEKRE